MSAQTPIAVRLDDETVSRLDELAEREGLSRHALMQRLLVEAAAEDSSGAAGQKLSRSLLAALKRQGWTPPTL